MTERTLDWRSEHDPRSLAHPIRSLIGTVRRRYVHWRTNRYVLDQGSEGACVGFGWTCELMTAPAQVGGVMGVIDGLDPNSFARSVYQVAKTLDEWAGEDYEGTSVLAGAKVVQGLRYIGSYRWAFGIDDVIDTLCSPAKLGGGPVVFGIPWFDSMYETRPSGLVEVGGRIVGGHCITGIGYHPNMQIDGEPGRHEVVIWQNSWGPTYGRRGKGYVKVADLEALLSSSYGAEACVPQHRRTRR